MTAFAAGDGSCAYATVIDQISELVTDAEDATETKEIFTKIQALDQSVLGAASKDISTCGADALIDLAYQRQRGGYQPSEQIFERLLVAQPSGLQDKLIPYWMYLVKTGFSKLSEYGYIAGLHKLAELDHKIIEIAASDGSARAFDIIAEVADIRAERRYEPVESAISRIPNWSNPHKLEAPLRFRIAKAYLDANLVYEATQMVSGLSPEDELSQRIAAGLKLAQDAAAALAKCTDPTLKVDSFFDPTDGLRWILASSAMYGPPDFVGQAAGDIDGEIGFSIRDNLGTFCNSDASIQQPLNWKGLFSAKNQPTGDTRLPHSLDATVLPQKLESIALDANSAKLLALTSAQADESKVRAAISKVFSSTKLQLRLLRTLDANAKLSDFDDGGNSGHGALPVTIKGVKAIQSAAFVDILLGGSLSGAEFALILDGGPRLFFVPLGGHQRLFDFADFKGDGVSMPILQTYDSSAGFLELDVIDVGRKERFHFGEPEDLYHGGIKLLDLDGDARPELTISAMLQDRLYDQCVQCPSRQTFYTYAYDQSGQFLLTGTHQTTADVAVSSGGGLLGISLGAALSFNRAETQKRIGEFSSEPLEDLSADEAESRVGELSNLAKSFYEAGDSQTGGTIANLILRRLEHDVKTSWAPLLAAKVRVEHAGALVDGGFDREALSLLAAPNVDAALGNGTISQVVVASLRSQAAFGTGDLTTAFASNEIVASSSEDFPNLARYASFLFEIGETEQAKEFAGRAAADGDAGAMALLASVDSNFKTAIRSLHQAIVTARTDTDPNATAAVLYRAGQIALSLGDPELAERFWGSTIFEAPPSWWSRNGARLLFDLSKLQRSDKDLSSALLSAAAKLGAETDSAVAPEALYALAQNADGQHRYELLAKAYQAATRHRKQVPGEDRKITFVAATDRIADEYFATALNRNEAPDRILSDLERWRFQVFTELYTSALPPITQAADNIEELRKRLSPTDALVVYYVGGETSFAIVADKDTSRIVNLRLEKGTLTKRIAETATLVRDRSMIQKDRVSPELKASLEDLYQDLIAPLDIPKDTQRLIIVPDKALQQVPWPALSQPSASLRDRFWGELGYPSLHPLLSIYRLNILPSSMLLEEADSRPIKIDRAVFVASTVGKSSSQSLDGLSADDLKAIGPELPVLSGTVKEIASGARALGLPPTSVRNWIFESGKPTTGRLTDILASLPRTPLIHLAAHGFFNASRPMASFLLLGADPKPLVLRASDLLTIDLRSAQLVMLSACSSGEVEINTGQEIFGFWRALFAAGAKRVILTRWPVDDATTAAYVSELYNRIGAGEAVEDAQQSALKSVMDKHKHPFFWAGYIISSRL